MCRCHRIMTSRGGSAALVSRVFCTCRSFDLIGFLYGSAQVVVFV